MRLSVIIPTYNSEKTIKKCIESILTNYSVGEVIVVDDGSIDNTEMVIKEIKKVDSRINYIKQKNAGPAVARRNGVTLAKEKYITFVDSDDYIKNGFYDVCSILLENEKIDILEFGFYEVFEKKHNEKSLKSEKLSGQACLEHYVKQQNTTNFLCNKIFIATLFHGIVWEELFAAEDAVVLTQVFEKCNYYQSMPECGYFYVMTADSLCRSNFSTRKMDNLKAYEIIKNLCQQKRPELTVYIDYKICSISALLYMQCLYSNVENKNLLLEEILRKFKDARKHVPIKFIKENGSFFRKIMILLFSVSPKLCSVLGGFVLR